MQQTTEQQAWDGCKNGGAEYVSMGGIDVLQGLLSSGICEHGRRKEWLHTRNVGDSGIYEHGERKSGWGHRVSVSIAGKRSQFYKNLEGVVYLALMGKAQYKSAGEQYSCMGGKRWNTRVEEWYMWYSRSEEWKSKEFWRSVYVS
jgi:hypothetical protein